MAGTVPTTERTDPRVPELPLPLLLLELARDPETGAIEGRSRLALAVRAACLIELGDRGALVLDGRSLRAVARDKSDAGGAGGPGTKEDAGSTVAAVAAEVAADPKDRSARHWVNRQALHTFDAAADELVARGHWTTERTGLLARSSPRYSGAEDETAMLHELLREAATTTGVPDHRVRDLSLLLEACRALSNVLPAPERRQLEGRIRGWDDLLRPSRPVAAAAVATVRSSSAAYLAAVAS